MCVVHCLGNVRLDVEGLVWVHPCHVGLVRVRKRQEGMYVCCACEHCPCKHRRSRERMGL